MGAPPVHVHVAAAEPALPTPAAEVEPPFFSRVDEEPVDAFFSCEVAEHRALMSERPEDAEAYFASLEELDAVFTTLIAFEEEHARKMRSEVIDEEPAPAPAPGKQLADCLAHPAYSNAGVMDDSLDLFATIMRRMCTPRQNANANENTDFQPTGSRHFDA